MKPRTVILLLCFLNLVIECVAVSQTIGVLTTCPSPQLRLSIQPLLTDDRSLPFEGTESFVPLATGAIRQ